jgi:hypothetical protein
MKNAKLFKKHVKKAWEAIKGAYDPKFHPALRNTLLKLIAAEDTEFTDFVELMKISGWQCDVVMRRLEGHYAENDWINRDLDRAAIAVSELRKDAQEQEVDKNKAASTDVAIIKCKGCGQFTETTSAKHSDAGVFCNKCVDQDSGEPVLHQCHYCGDMYHVSDLTGAKEGLICYKCRHEMENRE